jgi:uncharacterized protein (TIGR02679 family)
MTAPTTSGPSAPLTLRQYLVAHPAWGEILATAWKRYTTYNGLAGAIVLTDLAQVDAVQRIECKLVGRKERRVTLVELDRAFRESTRFKVSLADVLTTFFDRPLITRAEAGERADLAWAELQQAVTAADAGPGRTAAWLRGDGAYLRTALRDDPVETRRAAEQTARALGLIGRLTEPVALPVLAQRACGHPHGLDKTTLAGRFLERALVCTSPEVGLTLPLSGAEERELLLASANVAVDDVSSTVLAYHLLGADPIIAGGRAQGYVHSLPLATVTRLRALGATGGVAYVVENPAVFSHLMAVAAALPAERRPTLVCTSGQLSLAARRLLALLVESGASLRYGGDFDQMGLTIARGILTRAGGRATLWRMAPADYACARAATEAAGSATGPLDPVKLAGLTIAFPELTTALIARGPAFQEALLESLVADLIADSAARLPVNPI